MVAVRNLETTAQDHLPRLLLLKLCAQEPHSGRTIIISSIKSFFLLIRILLDQELFSACSGSSRTSPAMSPVKSTSRTSLHSPGSTTSSSCSLSRIPRPVTSPVRPPTGIPLPRCATSPTQTQIPPLRKPSLPLPQVSSKIASKGLGQKNICCDLSLNIFSVFFSYQGKRTSTVGTRASRVDQSHPMEHRSPATRPSSLPYSPVTTGHPDLGRKSSQRRANSASVNRPAPSTRKAKSAPR